MLVAWMTWQCQPWLDLPIRDAQLPRLFSENGQGIPYIRDLFDFACAGRENSDIVVFTNADICVSSDCARRIQKHVQKWDACYSHRRDFYSDFQVPKSDSEIVTGHFYVGCDLFALTVAWWQSVRDKFPDLLLGRESWDAVLRTMMDRAHPKQKMSVDNISYHRRHDSHWEKAEHRHKLPSQVHCIRAAYRWCQDNGVDHRPFGLVPV